MKRDPTPAKWGIIFCLQCSCYAVCLWCWCLNSFPKIPPFYCLPVSLWQLITFNRHLTLKRSSQCVLELPETFQWVWETVTVRFSFFKKDLCVWMFACMYVCVPHVPGTFEGQKRALHLQNCSSKPWDLGPWYSKPQSHLALRKQWLINNVQALFSF